MVDTDMAEMAHHSRLMAFFENSPSKRRGAFLALCLCHLRRISFAACMMSVARRAIFSGRRRRFWPPHESPAAPRSAIRRRSIFLLFWRAVHLSPTTPTVIIELSRLCLLPLMRKIPVFHRRARIT